MPERSSRRPGGLLRPGPYALPVLVADPETQVLVFDSHEATVEELNRANWRLPTGYTAASAPYLDWLPGAWPWFRVYASQPLELPFASGDATWVALRYLRDATTDFAVLARGLPPVSFRGRLAAEVRLLAWAP